MASTLEFEIALPGRNSGQLVNQLHRQLRAAIVGGRLSSGSRLPPTRKLASELGVSRNTIVAAYDLLLSEGYVNGKVGSGHYVTDAARHQPASRRTPAHNPIALIAPSWRRLPLPTPHPLPEKIRYDFRFGHPDVTQFPHRIWQRLSARALRQAIRSGEAAGPPEGLDVLRGAITHHISFSRAVACRPDDVVVTNGAQQGFSLLAQLLVRPGKTVVAVENPGYPPARFAFAALGAKVRPVPVDAEGIVVSRLPRDANIIFVTPTHQSPLGITLSASRRTQLLAFARENSAVIIEDDYDSEFRFGDRPHDALQMLDKSGLVFYVGTFTKSLLPGLRMGFVVSPPWATEALIAAKRLADGQSAVILQSTLAAFILEGHLARYVRKMRKVYSSRYGAVRMALAEFLPDLLEPIPTSAGIHCAAQFRNDFDMSDVMRRATKAGIAIEDLDRYWIGAPWKSGLAFGYGVMDEARIAEGIACLAKVLKQERRPT